MAEQPIQQETSGHEKPKWYQRSSSLIIGFLVVGPFILPLVWFNPKYSSSKKVLYTVIILVVSALLIKMTIKSFETIGEYYHMLEGQL